MLLESWIVGVVAGVHVGVDLVDPILGEQRHNLDGEPSIEWNEDHFLAVHDSVGDDIGDILLLEHGDDLIHPRLESLEHAGVNSVRAHHTSSEMLVSGMDQLDPHTIVEAVDRVLGGHIAGDLVAAQQGGHRGDGHDVALQHVLQGDGQVRRRNVIYLHYFQVVVVGLLVPLLRNHDARVVDQHVDGAGSALDESNHIVDAIHIAKVALVSDCLTAECLELVGYCLELVVLDIQDDEFTLVATSQFEGCQSAEALGSSRYHDDGVRVEFQWGLFCVNLVNDVQDHEESYPE